MDYSNCNVIDYKCCISTCNRLLVPCSKFKLHINLASMENRTCSIKKQSSRALLLKEASLIVWDESAMAHKGVLEALDRLMRDIKPGNTLMGNTCVLLAGNFQQILPVITRGTRADQVNACLKSSNL